MGDDADAVNSFANPAAALKLLNRKPTMADHDRVVLPKNLHTGQAEEETDNDTYLNEDGEGGEDEGGVIEEESGEEDTYNSFSNPLAALKSQVSLHKGSPLVVPQEPHIGDDEEEDESNEE